MVMVAPPARGHDAVPPPALTAHPSTEATTGAA